MNSGEAERFWRSGNPVMWGVIATLFVLALGSFVFVQPDCKPSFWVGTICNNGKWASFLDASPNEVGDTVAGFAGALAFVWLVATVWLQSQELREQRHEFKKMADAQSDQVDLLVSQGKILQKEQEQREKEIHARHLESLLVGLSNTISMASKLDTLDSFGQPSNGMSLIFPKSTDENPDLLIKSCAESFDEYWRGDLVKKFPPERIFASNTDLYFDLYELVTTIEALHDKLEIDRRQRLRNMKFENLRSGVVRFLGEGYVAQIRERTYG